MNEKVAVVTGGSKGLGKELAGQLVKKGYRVVICATRKDELQKTAEEIGATAFVADVTKETEIKDLADFAVALFGRIDIWINNAGIWMPHAPVEQLDIERAKQMFEVNVFGVMNSSKVALIQMQKQGSGTIINISSTSGLTGRPTSSSYAASKWAVRGFTESLRKECEGSGIKVITVYPGGMRTSFFEGNKPADIGTYMDPASVAEKIIQNLEQGTPEEELIIKRPA